MSSDYKELPLVTSDAVETVDDVASLPANSVPGDIRYVIAEDSLYTSDGSTWSPVTVGDVEGPGSSVDNTIPRFNGTSGGVLQSSSVVINDAGGVIAAVANNEPAFVINTAGPTISLSSFAGIRLDFNTIGPLIQFYDTGAAEVQVLGRATKDLALACDGTNASKGVIVRGSSGQTAKLLRVQLDGGTEVFSIDTSGNTAITTTTGAFSPPRMTGTQRDALTAANGMVIYNTSTDKFQGRAAGAWVDLH